MTRAAAAAHRRSRAAGRSIALAALLGAGAPACRQDGERARAAPAPAAPPDAGGARTCAVGDAPARTLSDAMTPQATIAAMEAVADWQLANPATRWPTTEWTYAPFWIGLGKLATIAADRKYYLAIRASAEADQWKPGPRQWHADDQAVIARYLYLSSVERERAMIEPSLARLDETVARKFDEPLAWDEVVGADGRGTGKTAVGTPAIMHREWAWCDALFMAPPAMAAATASTGDMKYLARANQLWWKTTDYLYDKTAHLYYRDSRFFTRREPNGKNVFWSRGNGWVIAGTARMLQNMPEAFPDRGRYVALFREMAAALAPLQGSDGFWRASLLDPDSVPKPESSGTAFFTYALGWGINQGLLDRATYEPVVRKGWTALAGAVSDGKLGWVQPVGYKPGDTCWDRTEVYGAGAFLLAGSEIYRSALLAGLAPVTRVVRNPGGETRFDEVVDVPLPSGDAKAAARGEAPVVVDGRSGDFLVSQPKPGARDRLLVLVGSVYPGEERPLHIYRGPSAPGLADRQGRTLSVPAARGGRTAALVVVRARR